MTIKPPGTQIIRDAQKLLAAGQVSQALQLLRQAEPGASDPEIHLYIALALRMQGDLADFAPTPTMRDDQLNNAVLIPLVRSAPPSTSKSAPSISTLGS